MNSENKISILGCGWLGLPLAEDLINLGYVVNGSTTTPAKLELLKSKGIKPFLIHLAKPESGSELNKFLDAEYLIISFPPGLRSGNGENYLQQVKFLAASLTNTPVKYILFVSSTSVYPELNITVNEAENLEAYTQENILLQAENLFVEINKDQTTILRLGGLVGGTRHPGRFLAGKNNVANPNAPVNLIHLQDCRAIVTDIIQNQKWGQIYNGCADEHPTRQEFYTAAALKLNLDPPQFAPALPTDKYKIVSNKKLKSDLPYRFIFPDPLLFM